MKKLPETMGTHPAEIDNTLEARAERSWLAFLHLRGMKFFEAISNVTLKFIIGYRVEGEEDK